MDIQQEMPGIDHQDAALSPGRETPAAWSVHGIRNGDLSAGVEQTNGPGIRHSREDYFTGAS
jgi:hypothetical protein